MFREKICRLVALLALNDRLPDAKAVVVKALENLDVADFRSDLESAMIGHFPES
jgi:hypothetical protein